MRNTIYCVHCSPQTCHLSNVLCTVQAIWSTLYLTKTLLWLHLDAINQVYCKWWHLTTNSHCITPCICTFSPFWTYVLFIYYIIILGKPSNKKFDICQIPLDPPPLRWRMIKYIFFSRFGGTHKNSFWLVKK